MRNITIALLSFLATSVMVIAANAQSTSMVALTLNQKSFEVSADDQARVNLIKEIQKINPAAVTSGQLEIQMVRVTAKTGIGGAQFFLRVNNDFVDSQSLETNPDQLSDGDVTTASRVELKNIERDKITEASLIIQGYSNSKIFSVEVVMGAVTEVAILGHYADQQVRLVGGTDDASVNQQTVLKPSTQALADINTRYYTPNGTSAAVNSTVANQVTQTLQDAASAIRNGQSTDTAPVIAATAAAKPVVQQAPREEPRVVEKPKPVAACATNRRGSRICVGDKVHNRWGFSGVVQDMKQQDGQNFVLVKFGFGDNKWRDIDSISE